MLLYSQKWERKEKDTEGIFCVGGMRHPRNTVRGLSSMPQTPENTLQTFGGCCHSGASRSGSARSDGCSPHIALLCLEWPMFCFFPQQPSKTAPLVPSCWRAVVVWETWLCLHNKAKAQWFWWGRPMVNKNTPWAVRAKFWCFWRGNLLYTVSTRILLNFQKNVSALTSEKALQPDSLPLWQWETRHATPLVPLWADLAGSLTGNPMSGKWKILLKSVFLPGHQQSKVGTHNCCLMVPNTEKVFQHSPNVRKEEVKDGQPNRNRMQKGVRSGSRKPQKRQSWLSSEGGQDGTSS